MVEDCVLPDDANCGFFVCVGVGFALVCEANERDEAGCISVIVPVLPAPVLPLNDDDGVEGVFEPPDVDAYCGVAVGVKSSNSIDGVSAPAAWRDTTRNCSRACSCPGFAASAACSERAASA